MSHVISPEALDAALASEEFVAVRRRIFRQLVASLVYEGLAQPEAVEGNGQSAWRLRARDLPVCYEFRARRRFSFDRVWLTDDPVVRRADGAAAEAESLSQFLHELACALEADPHLVARFADELDRTLLHDTMARCWWRQQGRPAHGCTYDELEGLIIDGHRYHPSYKSRVGFDHVDNARFGPEFLPLIQPIWLAAHHSATRRATVEGLDAEAFVRAELGQATHDRFLAMLAAKGYNPDDYTLIPAHPWQWRERLVPALTLDLRSGRLVVLGCADERYRPQQSIRTLANASCPWKACIKLPLGIINTSTARNLAPHTVLNAPLITDWLARLVAGDEFLRDELRPILLGEVMGVAYEPAPFSSAPAGALSCIWREALPPRLEPGEQAIPFTALCHIDSDGAPFVAEWVNNQGVEAWARSLLEVALPPVIHLLYAHGIALEAHAQNVGLVHEAGIPRRLVLKDFHDGIRFSPAHLGAPADQPRLHTTPTSHLECVNLNSYIEAETAREVRDFVHDAFFFVNLSEHAIVLADFFGLDERRFWALAATVIDAYQRRFSHLADRFTMFDVFATTVRVEQLTTRRLLPDTTMRTHLVRNPLARARPAAQR
jgi:siderophore synthetase component